VCSAQKATEAHVDLNLEWWLIVSDLNGKENGWTFSEHLTNVKFHDICSALFVLAHAYIERYLLAVQIVAKPLNYEYRVVLIDTMLG
jgi:hypothetical protein